MIDVISLGEMIVDIMFDDEMVFKAHAGGAPANVAINCSKLGCRSAFIGKRGNDFFGDFLYRTLVKENVNVNGFVVDKKAFTGIAFVFNDNGQPVFQFYGNPPAHELLKNSDINKDLFINAKWFHFGSISLYNDISKNATIKSIKLARKNNMIVSYDPNLRKHLLDEKKNALSLAKSVLALCDVVKVSVNELHLMTNRKNEKEAIDYLFNKRIKVIAVTRGDKGATIYTKQFKVDEIAPNVKVVDTTGAGDAFMSALITSIIKTNTSKDILEIDTVTMKKILKFSVYISAMSTETVGATAGVRRMGLSE